MSKQARPPGGEERGRRVRKAGGEAESREGGGNGLVEWAKSIGVAIVLFLVLRTFLVGTFVITSGSMEDTLLVGDMLVVNRLSIGTRVPATTLRIPGYSQPRHGDVIVFDPHHEPDMKLVKRLIGLPGDTLQMRNRVLYRNGEVVDEPYVKHQDIGDDAHPWMEWQREHLLDGVDPRTYSPTRDTWGPIVIPQDRYFMLGDNRETSLDSRYWGLLERWRLEGRVVFVYFSYNKESYRPFPWLREIRWGRIFHGVG